MKKILISLSIALLVSCNESSTSVNDVASSSSAQPISLAASSKVVSSSSLQTLQSSQAGTSATSAGTNSSSLVASSAVAPVILDCPASLAPNTLCDARTGNVFKTTQIGTQLWMAENMRFAKDGAWCYEGGACKELGHLYIQKAALDVCPKGWRLPSDTDWVTLAKYAGGVLNIYNAADTCWAGAGTMLRSTDTWLYPEADRATDDFGFNALPTGQYTKETSLDIIQSSFLRGSTAYFWSTSTNAKGDMQIWSLASGATCLDVMSIEKEREFYHSVRCIAE